MMTPASPTAPAPPPDGTSTSRCPPAARRLRDASARAAGPRLPAPPARRARRRSRPGARVLPSLRHAGRRHASAAPSRGFASALPWAVAALALRLADGARRRPALRRALVTSATADVLDGANMQGATPIGPAPPAKHGRPVPCRLDAARAGHQPADSRAARRASLRPHHDASTRRGRQDAVRTFVPMALAAYEMLDPLNLDQRYDLGRIGRGRPATPRSPGRRPTPFSQKRPTHLLGLILGARRRAHGEERDARAERSYATSSSRRRRPNARQRFPNTSLHKNDIDTALAAVRSTPK